MSHEQNTIPGDGELYRSIIRIESSLAAILEQTIKTNGRVTELEKSRAVQEAKLDVVTNIFKWAVGIPTAIFISVSGSLLYAWFR